MGTDIFADPKIPEVRIWKAWWGKALCILTVIGAIASICTAVGGLIPWGIAIGFAVLAIATSLTAIRAQLQMREMLREWEITERPYRLLNNVHFIVHETRDLMQQDRLADAARNPQARAALFRAAIQTILSRTSDLFWQLSKEKCVASLMLLSASDEVELETVAWCDYAEPDRTDAPATRLREGEGVAWRAFTEMRSILCNDLEDAELGFVGVRNTWRSHYLSAIVCPFRVNGAPGGILNIDCKKKNVFRENSRYLVQAAADLLALTIQVHQSLENGSPNGEELP